MLALHRQYGPVVRIGPTHVSVADFDSVNAIYRQATTFLKTDWYDLFTEKGKGVIFNIRNKELHAKRRRIVSHGFSLSSTRVMLPFIRTKALHMVAQLAESSEAQDAVDVSLLMRRLAGDVSLKVSLGQDWRQVENRQSCQLVDDLVARGSADGPTRALASRLARWGSLYTAYWSLLGSMKSGDWATASRIVRADGTIFSSVSDFRNRCQDENDEDVPSELLSRIIAAKDPATGHAMDFQTLCMEARGFILAASDTTANTLTMAVNHVSRSQSVWTQLHRELKEAIPSMEAFQDSLQDTSSYYTQLPFLVACIKETYRLSPAIAKLLPRHAPTGGCSLAGHHVPAGTIVGTSIFVQHRWDEDLWGPSDYADEFHPERWLESSQSSEAEVAKLKKMNSFL